MPPVPPQFQRRAPYREGGAKYKPKKGKDGVHREVIPKRATFRAFPKLIVFPGVLMLLINFFLTGFVETAVTVSLLPPPPSYVCPYRRMSTLLGNRLSLSHGSLWHSQLHADRNLPECERDLRVRMHWDRFRRPRADCALSSHGVRHAATL